MLHEAADQRECQAPTSSAPAPSLRGCRAGVSRASIRGKVVPQRVSRRAAGWFASSRRTRARRRRGAAQERQAALDLEPDAQPVLPSLELLSKPPVAKAEAINEEALEKNARLLET